MLAALSQQLERLTVRHSELLKTAAKAKSVATATKARLEELAAVAAGEGTAHEDAAREMDQVREMIQDPSLPLESTPI